MREFSLPYDGTVEIYNYKEAVEIIQPMMTKVVEYKKKKYFNIFGAFDIETSRIKNLNFNNQESEYLEYFNFPYCWSFMVEDKFFFGRDISEFFQMLKDITDAVGTDVKTIIYVHNLSFEFNNLRDYFLSGYYAGGLYKNSLTPLMINWGAFEFRCSYQLTRKKLEDIGGMLGYEKLKGFDYSKTRGTKTELTPEEMNYCYRDVKIIIEYITQEAKAYSSTIRRKAGVHLLPYTSTGYVRHDIRKNFSNQYIGREKLRMGQMTPEMFDMMKSAFWGGYVCANTSILGNELKNTLHVDMTSAHPAAMITKTFPTQMYYVKENTLEKMDELLSNPNTALIVLVRFKNIMLNPGFIPYIPVDKCKQEGEYIEEGGKLVYAVSLCICCTDIDYKNIKRAYTFESVEVLKMLKGTKNFLPAQFVKILLKYYEEKTTLKGVEGKEYEYILAKRRFNGIFGVAATSLERGQYECIGYTVKKVNENFKNSNVLPYVWGIYTAAYTRDTIYSVICGLETDEDFYYSDTDSIFCKDTQKNRETIERYNNIQKDQINELRERYPNIIPTSPSGKPQYLGVLEEEDEDIDIFCTVGPKKYYITHGDGTIDLTISGLSGTKVKNGKNGPNTERLLKKYKTINRAFLEMLTGTVELPFLEGVDTYAKYNANSDFRGEIEGEEVFRPCSCTLYGKTIHLSCEGDIEDLLSYYLQETVLE